MASMDYYRKSTLGKCLTDALDELVSNGTITPDLAVRVILQFDKSLVEALETKVKSKTNFKGHLHTYRFCESLWTFILTDAVFQTDGEVQMVDRVKIVAADSKLIAR
ncbi:unnamed protein product [Closterium sp. Naga37s-1]|nr:unnamed protein product [Closterium sp. Yama58-4]CAI5475588.1 unnamed protein product [Closterium sp. Yama58-4]CAI5515785.1 unnamed protein product [Closterium sp. Naga37s-1]CAI5943880.1 unnamed protein product [Closterium sp. NIES-65]CAI6003786.1 unnamed protein product [Closterium sp. NIES-65]